MTKKDTLTCHHTCSHLKKMHIHTQKFRDRYVLVRMSERVGGIGGWWKTLTWKRNDGNQIETNIPRYKVCDRKGCIIGSGGKSKTE